MSSASRHRPKRQRRPISLRGLVVGLLAVILPAAATAFEAQRAAFAVRVNDLEIPYRIFAIYALPGESLELRGTADGRRAAIEVADAPGPTHRQSMNHWTFRAPERPGVSRLVVENGGDRIDLNIVVMVPASRVVDERLNGFRIGSYPQQPLRGSPLYLPPDGFIELTKQNSDLQVSPHFRLAQFPAKQAGGFPKYLVLREQLLLKLELLLEALNEDGTPAESLTIMSGYRTPYYNAAINNVPYSRHVYGGAADIYVDESPRDGVMDDLDGNGRIDYRDAQHLFRLADRLFARAELAALRGGLGVYRRNSAHGPFLHVDARQQRARWGLLP